MPRFHLLLSLIVLLLPGPVPAAEPLDLSARRVDLNPAHPGQIRVGPLTWMGGFELSSGDERFGGLSGLLVDADGGQLTAVTDRGDLVTASLTYDLGGWLVGVTDGRIAALSGLNGTKLEGKRQKDAESLAWGPDGSLVVSFEHTHRIWRYAPTAGDAGLKPAALPPPEGLDKAPKNKGVEALVALDEGRLLAITQGRDKDPDINAYLWQDGAWSRLGYPKHGAFKPTGAARLPGGDIVVLERCFTLLGGLAARLVRLDAAAIQPGAALEGREIVEIRPPFTVDNMEGIAARRDDRGRTLIYLLSDDNFNAWQRTLLLMFALDG